VTFYVIIWYFNKRHEHTKLTVKFQLLLEEKIGNQSFSEVQPAAATTNNPIASRGSVS
jgi:hypothetical protein